MNEQAEFANFTAQQMQEEEKKKEEEKIRAMRDTSDGKHTRKRSKREVVDVARVNDTSERSRK